LAEGSDGWDSLDYLEKKTFEEARDDVPSAMNTSHAFVRASSPICMALFIAPIHKNRLASSKEKKASKLRG
jgi:hypothetical protein